MIYSLQTRNKLETRMICLFSFVQNQSAALNPSMVTVDTVASSVTTCDFFAFAFVDYLWLLSDYLVDTIALSEFYLHLWLWMNLLVILKFICIYMLLIYLYELHVMLIVNYVWCL